MRCSLCGNFYSAVKDVRCPRCFPIISPLDKPKEQNKGKEENEKTREALNTGVSPSQISLF